MAACSTDTAWKWAMPGRGWWSLGLCAASCCFYTSLWPSIEGWPSQGFKYSCQFYNGESTRVWHVIIQFSAILEPQGKSPGCLSCIGYYGKCGKSDRKTVGFLLSLVHEQAHSYIWMNIGQTIIEQFAISPTKSAIFQKHTKHKRATNYAATLCITWRP